MNNLDLNRGKVLIFQPWGIGDILMAVPAAKKLTRNGYAVDLISAQKDISIFLVENNIFQSFYYVKWTKNKIINLVVLLYFCFSHFRRYEFLLIPDGLSIILVNILKLICGNKVNSVGSIKKQKWNDSRIKNNISISEIIIMKKLKKNDVILFDYSDYKFKVEVKKSKKNRIAIFMGASESFKAPPVEGVILACDILRAEGVSFCEITDGKSYSIASKRSYIQKIPFLTFGELYKLMSEIDMLIAGDTGLAHFASLCGVKVIMLAGPTNYASTSPLEALVVLSDKQLPCRPCYGTPLYGRCPFGVECMQSITSQNIITKVRSNLMH